jgi:polyhydroxyalkanoate synthesis regulator phasin
MKRDIKAIVTLLATQSMINLGEIADPLTKTTSINLSGAKIFIDLVEVLKKKTKGNLSNEEDQFIKDVLSNLKKVYQNKSKRGN